MKHFLLLALFLLSGAGHLYASPVCTMTALYDTHAVEDHETIWKRGVRNSPVTQLVVDKRSGAKSFCIHGGYCYLAVVNLNGHAVEALRMTTCRVQRGDSGSDDGESITYGLEGIPSPASSRTSTDAVHDVKGLRGRCTLKSHTSHGSLDEDITDSRTIFACDTAAFTFLDDKNSRVRIMFFDSSQIKGGSILGFEGAMQSDGATLTVTKMYYLSTDVLLHTSDGSVCGIEFENNSPKAINCYGIFMNNLSKYLGEVDFMADPD